MLHVRRHLFHEFLFVYLFLFPLLIYHHDINAIFSLLHYSFLSVMKKNVWHSIEQRTLTHPLTSGIHDSKHAHVPKPDILNT